MKKKLIIAIAAVVVVGGIVVATVSFSGGNAPEVQTGKVAREDLATIVSASGEIKPKTYVNIGANAFGKITRLFVKEGDHVKRGQMLAQLENVQSNADVNATRAGLDVSRTDAVAAQAGIERARSDVERTKQDWERAQGLYQQGLIPKSEFDMRKSSYDSAAAAFAQAKAQNESASRRISQNAATLTRASDVLSKTQYLAPYDGVVTSLPVREGETVVVGIQNSPGSTLMTLADMSVITAEVRVDETDIVNVRVGQPAEVTIDAIPNKKFPGIVTEIGNIAILRSTGLATSQTTAGSQEAKDFKVVVTLTNPPENLRPGLSTTAKVTTAAKQNTLAIPLQALTIRTKADLEEKKPGKAGGVEAATPAKKDAKDEIQGVFVLTGKGNQRKAQFKPVETGITGTTNVEVVSGLAEGDEIVIGSYKVLRTLKNGASVKVNNVAPKKEDKT
ncbi:MAG: efflux RND transporter periplasmic adaptor subunit [Acidobacteriota bacterium]|nr:efflux RND transporter periplasmic adaptor subunit [Acidobacteriota bacterium]